MRFLILAVSYKYGGLCVAGININSLEYMRIGFSTSSNECGAIPCEQFKCKIKNQEYQLEILDVIDIDVTKMQINGCQTENYNLISINKYIGTLNMEGLHTIYSRICKNQFIFANNREYVSADLIDSVGHSLQFVRVEKFTVIPQSDINGRPKLRAFFEYNGQTYSNVRVTDSTFCAYPKCYGDEQQTCIAQSAYIMVSLPYDNWSIENKKFYKYVAGIVLI